MFNKKLKIDCQDLVRSLEKDSVNVCFFDPEYRGVMDYLLFGNEDSSDVRQAERLSLPQMTDQCISWTIRLLSDKIKPKGYLFLWVDKFHLLEGINPWLRFTDFQIVDMMIWDKIRMGMGYRLRNQCEFLVIIQKKPLKAKETWDRRDIRNLYREKAMTKNHLHQKPRELTKILIETTTEEGDLVLDPCAGSFAVLDVCKETHRTFIGTDIKTGDTDAL